MSLIIDCHELTCYFSDNQQILFGLLIPIIAKRLNDPGECFAYFLF